MNAAFFPALMRNGRFFAASGDPFDNSMGFVFPAPEATTAFPAHDAVVTTLLAAQAHLPPTELVEAAGFTGTARVIAEFEFTLVFADAPIDRFARGNRAAMTPEQKRRAIHFLGDAGCVQCHAVKGRSNEMFSDFSMHVLAVPQIAPRFGPACGNVFFDGASENEDFGLEQVTGNPADRYKFRTSPLRNVALQRAFFHDGSFTRLDDAIRHHLDVFTSARAYRSGSAGLDRHLTYIVGPVEPMLERVAANVATPKDLRPAEFDSLVAFVREGLLDDRARPQHLCRMVPASLPSGMPPLQFHGWP